MEVLDPLGVELNTRSLTRVHCPVEKAESPSLFPASGDRPRQVLSYPECKTSGMQATELLAAACAQELGEHWLFCVPARHGAGALRDPHCHPCSLTEQTGSTRFSPQRQPKHNIAWGRTHQGSNSTQEEGSTSAICDRGNPAIQCCRISLIGSKEVEAPASD